MLPTSRPKDEEATRLRPKKQVKRSKNRQTKLLKRKQIKKKFKIETENDSTNPDTSSASGISGTLRALIAHTMSGSDLIARDRREMRETNSSRRKGKGRSRRKRKS